MHMMADLSAVTGSPSPLVVLLVGPKGCGKSTTGQNMASAWPRYVDYVPAERIFIDAKEAADAETGDIYKKSGDSPDKHAFVDVAYDNLYRRIAAGAARLVAGDCSNEGSENAEKTGDETPWPTALGMTVVCESTGAAKQFPGFVQRLRRHFGDPNVRLIFLHAPRDVCSTRISQRDASGHMPVSDELINLVYDLSMAKRDEWGILGGEEGADLGSLALTTQIDTSSMDSEAVARAVLNALMS